MKSTVTDIDYLSKTRQEYEHTLSFAGRGLKLNKAEDTRELVSAINSTRPLKCLRLEGNTISPEAAEELAKALGTHPELERFIGNDIFTGRLKDEIPLALKSICGSINASGAHLVEINMADNAFGPIGLNALMSFFASAACYSLKEIRMHNNGLGPEGSKKFASSLEKGYENSGGKLALRVFVCGRNRLEFEGSRAISGVLKTMGTLEEIQMPQNGIRANGIQFLAEATEANPNLRILNFNDNTFLQTGAEQIAKAIAQLTKLEYVNLGDCLLKSKGAVMVARSLAKISNLKEAILSFNEITLNDGLEISELLLNNKQTLTLLDLNGNKFGEEGKLEITQCLEPLGHALASLSEDEGSEEEEEEEGEDEEEEEEEEDEDGEEYEDEEEYDEEDEEGEGEEENDQYDIIERKELPQAVASFDASLNPFSKLVISESLNTKIESIDKFVAQPNLQNLKLIDQPSLDSLYSSPKFNVSFVLRFSSFLATLFDEANSQNESSTLVLNLTSSLFKKIFENNDSKETFCDEFLTEFGLLKSEDKKFRPIAVNDKVLKLFATIWKSDILSQAIKDRILDYLRTRNSNLDTNKTSEAIKRQNENFIKCFS